MSWYGAAYLLAATAFQPTWGKIYQNFSLKQCFVFVTTIFLAGSIICAAAPNSIVFISGRAIAGAASGGIFLGVLTMIGYTVPLRRRALYTGGLSALFGVMALLFWLINILRVWLLLYSEESLPINLAGDGVSISTSPPLFSLFL